MDYICKLDSDLECPSKSPDNIHCNNNNTKCVFCVEEVKPQEYKPKGYIRKERWYEKYYK